MPSEHPLLNEYKKTIPEKLNLISHLIGTLTDQKTEESLKALHEALHTLCGNSGTYGFIKASNLCRSLDNELKDQLKNFSPFF